MSRLWILIIVLAHPCVLLADGVVLFMLCVAPSSRSTVCVRVPALPRLSSSFSPYQAAHLAHTHTHRETGVAKVCLSLPLSMLHACVCALRRISCCCSLGFSLTAARSSASSPAETHIHAAPAHTQRHISVPRRPYCVMLITWTYVSLLSYVNQLVCEGGGEGRLLRTRVLARACPYVRAMTCIIFSVSSHPLSILRM